MNRNNTLSLKENAAVSVVTVGLCVAMLLCSEPVLHATHCYWAKSHLSSVGSCSCQTSSTPPTCVAANNYYNDPYDSCERGHDTGNLDCQDPVQPVGKLYHCDTDIDWPYVLAIGVAELGVCATICVVSLGTACFECIIAALIADGIIAGVTCVFYKCTLVVDGDFSQHRLATISGTCNHG